MNGREEKGRKEKRKGEIRTETYKCNMYLYDLYIDLHVDTYRYIQTERARARMKESNGWSKRERLRD